MKGLVTATSALLALGIVAPPTASSQERTVAHDADELAAQIEAANANGPGHDVISLAADILLVEPVRADVDGVGLPSVTSAITIEGDGFRIARVLPAPDLPIDDPANCGVGLPTSIAFGLMRVSAEGALTLRDVRLEGGCSLAKGALWVEGGRAVLSGVSVLGNASVFGTGGGRVEGQGSLQLLDSVVADNVSEFAEGGLFVPEGEAVIMRSFFRGNRSERSSSALSNGGAMWIQDTVFGGDAPEDGNHSPNGAIANWGRIYFETCRFEHNQGGGTQGSVVINGTGGSFDPDAAMTVVRSVFVRNTVSGAVLRNSGVLQVIDATFAENGGEPGGQVEDALLNHGEAALIGSEFIDNRGGVFNGGGGTLRGVGLTFIGNQARTGGAVENDAAGVASRVVLDSCLFSDNSAQTGGAIYNGADQRLGELGLAEVVVTRSTFANNTSDNGGGAIASFAQIGSGAEARLLVSHSTFSGNTASDGPGGAFWLLGFGDESAVVSNSTFVDNHAATSGGAVASQNNFQLSVVHSTFVDNTADAGAGALSTEAALTAHNTLIAHIDRDGGHCAGLIDGADNLADDASCGEAFLQTDGLNLVPLAERGGLAATIALGPGSAAIGAAGRDACLGQPVRGVDQRDVPRGDVCDVGAHESDVASFAPATVSFEIATSDTSEGTDHDIVVELRTPDVMVHGNVVVEVFPGPGSARSGLDYGALLGAPVTFSGPLADGQATITLPVLDDGLAEPTEQLELILSVTGPARLGEFDTHVVTIGCGDSDARCLDGLVCAANTCVPPGRQGDVCDPGGDDCAPEWSCDPDAICRLRDGSAGCEGDDALCALGLVCVGGTCASPSTTGGVCLDIDDCTPGHGCVDGRCLLVDGERCARDDECVAVCDLTQQPPRCAPMHPMADVGPDVAMDAGPDVLGDADVEADSGGDSGVEVDASMDAEPDAPMDVEPDTPTDTESDASMDAEADTPMDAAGDTTVGVDAAPDVALDTEVDSAADAEVEADAEVDSGMESDTAHDAEPDMAADTEVELDTQEDVEEDAEAGTDAAVDTAMPVDTAPDVALDVAPAPDSLEPDALVDTTPDLLEGADAGTTQDGDSGCSVSPRAPSASLELLLLMSLAFALIGPRR